MKIIFIDQFGKTTGTGTLALAKLLAEKHDVTVYLSDDTHIPNVEYNFNIERGFQKAYVSNAVSKAIHYLLALFTLKKYIKKHNFDIIHLQWFSLPWIEWIYVWSLRKHGKIAITVHDVIPFNNRPLEMKCLNLIYNQADCLLLHTEKCLSQFEHLYNVNCQKFIVTQGFFHKPDYTKLDKAESKKYFGIPEEKTIFLYFGTIRHSKGLDLLIQAIGKAKKECANVHLLVAGAFHKVNEEEYQKLVDTHLDSDCATVNFGYIPQELEIQYFSAADVLCLPYREVFQSAVAQLGLMYDLPMIVTNVGEMTAVVRDGVNGLVVPTEDIELLSTSIKILASDRGKLEQYAHGSSIIGESEFSLEEKAKRIFNAYKYIMNMYSRNLSD